MRHKTLQWKSGYYTEAKAEATKCRQVIISAVVLKYVSWKVTNVISKQICDIQKNVITSLTCTRNSTRCVDTLCEAGEGGVASNSTVYQRRTDWDVGDLRPVSQSGLIQGAIDEEAVVVAYEGWGDTQDQIIRALLKTFKHL